MATVQLINGQLAGVEAVNKELGLEADHKSPASKSEGSKNLSFPDVPVPMKLSKDVQLTGVNITFNTKAQMLFFDIEIDTTKSSSSVLLAWFTGKVYDKQGQFVDYVTTTVHGFSAKYYSNSDSWSVYLPSGKPYASGGKTIYPPRISGPFADLLQSAALFIQKHVVLEKGVELEKVLHPRKVWTQKEAREHYRELMEKAYDKWVLDVIDPENEEQVTKAEEAKVAFLESAMSDYVDTWNRKE